jgi:hypothetical protein
MLYPNGQRTLAVAGTCVSGLLVTSGAMAYGGLRGARLNGTANFAKTASKPEGYAPHGAPVMPIKAGGMGGIGRIVVSGSGNLLQGGPMEGTGSIAWTTPDGSLSLTTSMSGTATITLSGNTSVLKLVIGMDGTGAMTFTGAGGLSMIVPFDGTGAFGITGSGDLRGRLSMDGSWTPFSELSPEGLAAAVWGAVATANNDAGTMGQKLNSAASGGVDYQALGEAVWAILLADANLAGSMGEFVQNIAAGSAPTAAENADAVRTELAAELAQLTKVSKIHGVGVPLVVTATSRVAGDLSQTISTVSGTTTVSAA